MDGWRTVDGRPVMLRSCVWIGASLPSHPPPPFIQPIHPSIHPRPLHHGDDHDGGEGAAVGDTRAVHNVEGEEPGKGLDGRHDQDLGWVGGWVGGVVVLFCFVFGWGVASANGYGAGTQKQTNCLFVCFPSECEVPRLTHARTHAVTHARTSTHARSHAPA